MSKKYFQRQGVDITKVIDPIFIVPISKIMGHMKHMNAELHGIISKNKNKTRKRTKINLQN